MVTVYFILLYKVDWQNELKLVYVEMGKYKCISTFCCL